MRRAAWYDVSSRRISSPRKYRARSAMSASSSTMWRRSVSSNFLAAIVHLLRHQQDGCGQQELESTKNGLAASSGASYPRPVMKGYGQFCPVAKAAEVFAERWTPLVLRELACGS